MQHYNNDLAEIHIWAPNWLSLTLCYFVLVFFSPFSIASTLLTEERANLSAFRTLVWFDLVWFCLFPLPLGVWEGLQLVIVALPGFFSYLFISLIPPKSESLLLSRRRTDIYHPDLVTNNHPVQDVDSHKHLGIVFSNDGTTVLHPKRGLELI